MILLDGAAAPPDQLVTLVQALAQYGPGPLIFGVWLFITMRRDKGENAENAAIVAEVRALADEVKALKEERATRERERRDHEIAERTRQVVLEEIRSGRVTGEMTRVDPSNTGGR